MSAMDLNGKVDVIGACLNSHLSEKAIISRYELLQQVYGCVRKAELTEAEREEMQSLLGEKKNNVAVSIFSNILSGDPIFMNLPKLDSAINVNDVLFHFAHTNNYGDPDFAKAFNRYQESQEVLKELIRLNLKDMLEEFMAGAGYTLTNESSGKLTFTSGEKAMDFRIFSSIEEVELVEGMEESAIIVPHAESPAPFIAFFQEKGAEADKAEVKVWVANMETGVIDPFIGYPKDLEIYKQFKNPRLVLMVKERWGRTEE